jgi:hypothetical protein
MDALLIVFVAIAVALLCGPVLLARVIEVWKVQVAGGALVALSAFVLLLLGMLGDDGGGTGDLLVPMLLVLSGAMTFASGVIQRKKMDAANS